MIFGMTLPGLWTRLRRERPFIRIFLFSIALFQDLILGNSDSDPTKVELLYLNPSAVEEA
eukprot:scaffold634848_cov59-Attheya_sp.AAC.1